MDCEFTKFYKIDFFMYFITCLSLYRIEREEKNMVENKSSNEREKKSKKQCKVFSTLKNNPWIISTVVLVVLVISLFFFSGGSCITGKTISGKLASEGLVSYLEEGGYSGFEIESVEKDGSMYLVVLSYEGQEIPFYVTREGYVVGNYLISVVPDKDAIEEVETEEELQQLERPETKLFIWSYCPYGVTALGPYAEVAKLLGDSADFKVYLYYAGHGDYEEQQNKIQACIQDLGYEEYWDYAIKFSEEVYELCYGNATCDLEQSISIMDSLGIDSDEVMSCVDSRGDDLVGADYEEAKSFGVTGSPTLMINGFKMSVSRTAEAYKSAVCSSYLDVPEKCGTILSTEGTASSGSC